MNAVAEIEVKGWCPGALRPMETGDGLIVRVRPRCGAFTLDQARALAGFAVRFGNGHLDLTRRANLQLRGVRDRALAELQNALDAVGLLDPDPETEAVRNVMVAPLAGIDPAEAFDVRPIARELEERCVRGLPPKFGMLVDGGGTVSIAGERADIALCAVGTRVALGIDTPSGTRWLGIVGQEEAAPAAIALAQAFLESGARGRMRHLASVEVPVQPQPLERAPAGSRRAVGLLPGAAGVAAPFGQLEAEQLHGLVGLAEEAGATSLRLSPWRTLYIEAGEPGPVLDGARALGLIVHADDPLLRVDACPGKPCCRSSSVETRSYARRLAERGLQGTLHVSGCAKGCARSAPADLVLVGEEGRFGMVHNGTTRDRPERWLGPDEL
jgi:precorrin-3B synthase